MNTSDCPSGSSMTSGQKWKAVTAQNPKRTGHCQRRSHLASTHTTIAAVRPTQMIERLSQARNTDSSRRRENGASNTARVGG